MLKSNNLEFLMEAHNGLSAKIVEEAGFKGIWGSGLSISAAMGVRDSNEASYTQVLEVCEFMVRTDSLIFRTFCPDCFTKFCSCSRRTPRSRFCWMPTPAMGTLEPQSFPLTSTSYSNFNNARRLVKKLEQIGIAGACIEDKLFPKTNSLLSDSEGKPLADMEVGAAISDGCVWRSLVPPGVLRQNPRHEGHTTGPRLLRRGSRYVQPCLLGQWGRSRPVDAFS
jgi:phosphoenolpyruvate phosphomutase